MAYDISLNRSQKETARALAINHCPKAAKLVFAIPSYGCLCLKMQLDEGKINRDTVVVVCEDDSKMKNVNGKLVDIKYIPAIETFLKKNFKKFIIFNSQLCDIDLHPIVEQYGKFDFCFFDICGKMTEPLGQWLESASGCFADSSYVVWTLASARGKKDFMEWDKDVLFNLIKMDPMIPDSAAREINDTFLLLRMNYKIKLQEFYRYFDHYAMVVAIFKIVGKGEGTPIFSPTNAKENSMKSKSPVMIEAGRKAWQTRLNNQRKMALRRRALKAWATRRRQSK